MERCRSSTRATGPADIEERHLRGRADGYHAYDHAHVAWAVVDEATRIAS